MKFTTVVFGLVGLSMATTTIQELAAQGVPASSLLPATQERLDLDRTWTKRLADEQAAYDEKRRIDAIQHEKDQLDAYENEVKARADWDKRAADVVAAGGPGVRAASADVYRQRMEWEGKVAFDRSQRERAWDAGRDHEERVHEDQRQSEIDEWSQKNRALREREALEYQARARKAWEDWVRPQTAPVAVVPVAVPVAAPVAPAVSAPAPAASPATAAPAS